jgi:predicted nuclease with RNAse H fold
MAKWIGVDVGGRKKGFDVALIDDRAVLQLEGGLDRGDVVELVERARPKVVAIDSPCRCAPEGHTSRDGERLLAKSICGIRWTPDERKVHASAYYAWVVEGLALFKALAANEVEVTRAPRVDGGGAANLRRPAQRDSGGPRSGRAHG